MRQHDAAGHTETIFWLGAVFLLILLLIGIVWTAAVWSFGPLGCEYKFGDSNYGELHWSVVPPGPSCVWTKKINGVNAREGPSWVPSVYLLAVGCAGLGLVVVARVRKRAMVTQKARS